MKAVSRAEFLADPAAIMRRSETEGPIGVMGDDGKMTGIVHAPGRGDERELDDRGLVVVQRMSDGWRGRQDGRSALYAASLDIAAGEHLK